MSRVLVTGAAGFLGRHVVADALLRGWEVVGLDRRTWTPLPGERRVCLDLLDPGAARVVAAAEAVVHLAGAPGVRDDRPGVARRRWDDNVRAVQTVVDRLPGDRPLLVASSSSVYGGAGPVVAPRPCREDDALRPRGGYARSKVALEAVVARGRRGPAPTTTVRPFTVAGEGQRADMALATWLAAARAGRPLHVFGSTARRRDVSDVREVAAAITRLLAGGHHGTFNLGSGSTHSLADHLDAVATVTGCDLDVRVEPSPGREVATTWADTTRLEQAVGGLVATPLRELVARQDAAARARGVGSAEPAVPRPPRAVALLGGALDTADDRSVGS